MLLGVIDTITAGFRLVTRHLWLLLLPIAMDLFFYFGPKLSMLPVLSDAVDVFLQTTGELPDMGAQVSSVELMAALDELVNEVFGRLNLFGLAAWTHLGFPSAANARMIDTASDTVYEITKAGQLFAVELGILAVGLFITAAFLVQIAMTVSHTRRPLMSLMRHVGVTWLRLLAILVPLGLGLLMASVLLSFMPGPVGILIMMGLSIGAVWAAIYLAFVPQAIALGDASPLAAINHSFALIRSFFGPSLGILFLIVILRMGFGLIWGRLISISDAVAMLAIIGSAYIGTALTAALFIFYRERHSVRDRQSKGVSLS